MVIRTTNPDVEDDAITDLATTSSGALTPSISHTTAGKFWEEFHGLPPLPGKRYIIKIKSTDRAITLTRDGLCLRDSKHSENENNRFLCVEQGTWLGFYNEHSRVFIGHDGNGKMRATATAMWDWELLQARRDPSGGFELQSPHWVMWKRNVNAADKGTNLVRTEHGCTLWVFEECE